MSTPRRFKFTHRLIDGLPPNESDAPSREAEYSDTEISGLKCLVGKGEGKKKFLLRYLWQGRKRAISIGHWPEIDVIVARKIATEMKRQIATGTDPRYERDKCRAIPTLQEAFSQYYFPWAKLHKKSWNKDEQRFRDHIAPVMGNLLLNEITPRHVTHLQSSLYETCQPATNNRVIALLKALLRWSLRHEMVTVNPAANIPLLRENNARQRYFSETEIRRIFDAASEDNSRVAGIYVRLLLLTGLRRDELRLAKWAHYSMQQGTLWLPETKNGSGRLVHLNNWAVKLIEELPRFRGNGWMFGGKLPGKPVCNVTKPFRRISFEFSCDGGEKLRVTFALDCCDREAIEWAASTGGYDSSTVQDVMLGAVEKRFGTQLPEKTIQWLTDNGSAYVAHETRWFARELNLEPCTTAVSSPQSNGMAERFVKTMKSDYITFMPKPDVRTALINLAAAFEHYNENHPHSALGYLSPREYRSQRITLT